MVKIAALITAVVITLIVIITVFIAKSASVKQDNAQASIYKYRSAYFYFLLISIAVLLYVTLNSGKIPYPAFKFSNPDLTVHVTGRTWSWELSTDQIPVNKKVEFVLETEDVTHGFGIFNEEGKIVAQAQVMPGYANRLRYEFNKPGLYRVLCLEYCGVSHHEMMTSFNVVENGSSLNTGGENEQ